MSIDEMIAHQIAGRGVRDKRVLAALRNVPRHLFVPPEFRGSAYEDYPLPIGDGQTISQPYIVALMTELLHLTGKEKVIEIGTGSGYQTAVLAELAKEVYTVEIIPQLADKAEVLLKELGYKNIMVKSGDGYLGWPEHAPFDAMIVTAAPEEIPEALMEQLAENGRMVLPVGAMYQELMVLTKNNGRLIQRPVLPVRFVPMIHKPQ